MKIDFNQNGMTINFDKVPKFLYFNENNEGCGQVLLDGVRRKGLQDIKIEAHTNGMNGRHPLKYSISYYDREQSSSNTISLNMKNDICIGIKILDIEQFKKVISCIKELIKDERIAADIKKEYAKKIVAAVNPEYVIYSGDGIYDFGTEEKHHD